MAKRLNLNWAKLLSPRRVCIVPERDGTRVTCQIARDRDSRSPFERDFCHIVYSSAFRRLARKTQLIPDPELDNVRFRLTHSLEVSTVADSLWRETSALLLKDWGVNIGSNQDVSWILRSAGVAHDIGNPPCGHAGERAIQKWAKKHFGSRSNAREFCDDLVKFDGNAEAFHILSRPDMVRPLYFRLTSAVLGAIIKYPITASDAPKDHPKFSAFNSDAEVLEAVMQDLGLRHPDGSYARHPLSFLLEAADDICYLLSDLDDAMRLGVLGAAEVEEKLLELYKGGRSTIVGVQQLKSYAAEYLIRKYSRAFSAAYDSLMKGAIANADAFQRFLPDDVLAWMNAVRRIERQVFKCEEVKRSEAEGERLLMATLERYAMSILASLKRKLPAKQIDIMRQVLNREVLDGDLGQSEEWWMHVVLDYVVGMSDQYLLGRSRTTTGTQRNKK